ncbi:MAG: hypothetical protein Q4D82_01500 [Neisseria sp.]|nr:hypothetical protein [Neisseria sp.]
MNALNYLNLVSAAVIFIYCCYRLGRKQFEVQNLELWAHTGLIGGAITMFTYSLQHAVIWPQAMFNASVALYVTLLTVCRKRSEAVKTGKTWAFDRVKTWIAGLKTRA